MVEACTTPLLRHLRHISHHRLLLFLITHCLACLGRAETARFSSLLHRANFTKISLAPRRLRDNVLDSMADSGPSKFKTWMLLGCDTTCVNSKSGIQYLRITLNRPLPSWDHFVLKIDKSRSFKSAFAKLSPSWLLLWEELVLLWWQTGA